MDDETTHTVRQLIFDFLLVAARLHRISVSVMSSSLLKDLTTASRLHLLPNKPSSVQIDAVVTSLKACIASRLAPKETSRRSRLPLDAW